MERADKLFVLEARKKLFDIAVGLNYIGEQADLGEASDLMDAVDALTKAREHLRLMLLRC